MTHPALLSKLTLAALGALALITGCKPSGGDAAQQPGQTTRDPSGIVVPVPGMRRSAPAARTVALCLANARNPHQRVQVNLLVELLRQASGTEISAHDAKGSVATQVEQLASLAAAKPSAVMVLPVDAAAEKESIQALRAAGSIVIGLDASLGGGACDSVVFCDQKKIGTLAGGLVVDALKRKAQDEGSPGVKGRVIQLQGDEKLPACRARSEGFTEAIKAEPGIVLVHDAATGWEKAGAILRFKEALRLQKGFDAVYAHNDIIALGASEASVEEKVRESLLIVGTDGVTGPGGGLEMLGKNAIDATVHQPLLVDFAWRLVERMLKDGGFKPKPAYEIEPVVFTPKNLDELRARGLKVPEL
ncbi:MAG: substrate-binding domain-containing protein [Verrucomicrobiaceae bacterium]|nr:substrate-binding domain-containing protein [Verrucomicrobiaceae bacterium]